LGACLSPKDYKEFVNAGHMVGEYDTYIDYLILLRKVPARVTAEYEQTL